MAYVFRAAVLFAAPPLSCPAPKVFLSLLMLTVLNSSFSSFFLLVKPTSAVWTTASHINLFTFPFSCSVETLHFTETHTIFCPWCELNNKSKLFKCQNSCHPLSQLQHSPGWAPSRPSSNVHNSCRRLQPFSHTPYKQLLFYPVCRASGSLYLIRHLSSLRSKRCGDLDDLTAHSSTQPLSLSSKCRHGHIFYFHVGNYSAVSLSLHFFACTVLCTPTINRHEYQRVG